MTNVKRYHSFLLGTLVATITWCVVLYLYLKLGNDLPVIAPRGEPNKIVEKNGYNAVKDVIVPYENSVQSLFYQKKKYYKNSEKLKKQLQPVLPPGDQGLGLLSFFYQSL